MKVVFAKQETVDLYADTARKFLDEVLQLDASEVLITDESMLSDFSSCGLPGDESYSTLRELYQAWDACCCRCYVSHTGSVSRVPTLA